MDFGYLDLKTAAARLHMDALELKHFAQREEVPAQKRGEDFFFERRLLDEWAQRRMIGLHPRQLTDEHAQAMSERAKSTGEVRIADLLALEAIAPALSAKNKGGVLRDMTDLAARCGKVYDADALFRELVAREEAASTAVGEGVALLHPKFHDPYLFEESFVAYGRSERPIFFGASNGEGTRHFFLICSTDHAQHLRILARLAVLAHGTDLVRMMEAAETESDVVDAVASCEEEFVS